MEWISDCEFKAATRLRCLRGPAGLGAYICLYLYVRSECIGRGHPTRGPLRQGGVDGVDMRLGLEADSVRMLSTRTTFNPVVHWTASR